MLPSTGSGSGALVRWALGRAAFDRLRQRGVGAVRQWAAELVSRLQPLASLTPNPYSTQSPEFMVSFP
ncbi:MAG: hypothetical protein AAGF95_34715 [Chloroflexota bacterium]